MPKGQNEKTKIFAKFLDKTKLVNFDRLYTMDNVLNLSISTLNFLNDADVDLIYELFQINTIGQFSSLDPMHPFTILYKDKKTTKRIANKRRITPIF